MVSLHVATKAKELNAISWLIERTHEVLPSWDEVHNEIRFSVTKTNEDERRLTLLAHFMLNLAVPFHLPEIITL